MDDSELKRFFVAVLFLGICVYTSSSTFPISLSNCTDRCGDIPVPYPFGIGQGCYKNKWFEIICNSTGKTTVPFLPGIKREVTSISQPNIWTSANSYGDQNKIGIRSPVKHKGCSNLLGDSSSLNLTGSPFFISPGNLFTAVGCNNKALMKGTGLQIVGCEATCESQTRSNNDLSGVGYKCCQTAIPDGLQVFDATVEKLEPGKELGCQVAYLTRFTLADFMFTLPELESSNYVAMELEWRLDVPSMITERSLHCDINTVVLSRDNQYLYQCWCQNGYEGNPYLPGGCQDIDECRDPIKNSCGENKCVNVPGSFRCEKTWPEILGETLSAGLLLLIIGLWWLCKVNKKAESNQAEKEILQTRWRSVVAGTNFLPSRQCQ